MSVRIHHYPGLAVVLLLGWRAGLHAEEPAPSRPTPIIFSAPRSDTVSSNLNQINANGSPLTDLESGLKKPFEIFDSGRSSDKFNPAPMRFNPPAPTINSKKLKELMEKRAEEIYLSPEDNEAALSGDDWLKSDQDALDRSGKKLKTPLDRYYDRIDRMRAGQTNQTRGLELFGEKNEPDDKNDSSSRSSSGGTFGNDFSVSGRSVKQMTNSSSDGEKLSSGKLRPRSFGDIFGLSPVDPSESATRPRESRLDEFKRLLDGPAYGPRNDFNSATPPSLSTSYQPSKPVMTAPGASWSPSPLPAVGSSSAGASGFVGTPAKPAVVPDFAMGAPSLTPVPPVQPPKPLPPPTFNIPRRRF